MLSSTAIDTGGAIIEVDEVELERGSAVSWCVSPENVTVDVETESDSPGRHRGIVVDVLDIGRKVELAVAIDHDLELWALGGDLSSPRLGERCTVGIRPSSVVVWPTPVSSREAALR
jgi:hypothetical protein